MKVLIVSDTHGKEDRLLRVVEKERPIDKIVHLGDIGSAEAYIEKLTDCICFCVKGNNDYYSSLPDESIIMMGKHRAFITHGHHYGVYYGTKELERHANILECDTIMYGHTHFPELTEGRLTILNPGSLTYPRQPGREPSYIIAEIDDEGNVKYELKFLQK